jgi:hypothetical protein
LRAVFGSPGCEALTLDGTLQQAALRRIVIND